MKLWTPPAVSLALLVMLCVPARSYANSWIGSYPNPYSPFSLIVVDWSGEESEACNDDEWFDAQISGTDGFWEDDQNDYGNGEFDDGGAPTGSPGSWTYYLDLWIYGDFCDYNFTNSTTESSEAPHPSTTTVESEGSVSPLSCGGLGGCTNAPWGYRRIYQLVDQWGSDFHEADHVTENLSSVSDSCGNVLIEQDTYADANGRFADYPQVCSSVCCGGSGSCSSEYTQQIYAQDYYNVRNVDIQLNCSGLISITP